ncbi:hypothetical protein CMK11_13380 [Candidatus Poribacteria bacterium]|nr:hypothetical protein [Candidatus Poribacteria bacterium]
MRDLLACVAALAWWVTTLAAPALLWAQGPELTASFTPQIEFNNHIEFGISVDPSTVSASRTSPQLRGSRSTLEALVEATHDSPRVAYRLALAPSVENYSGEGGFLDQFDGTRLPLAASLTYRPWQAGPGLRLRAQATRLTREAAIYDNWEPTAEISVGEFASYEFRRRVFDDSDRREDYLLISSTRHQGRVAGRILHGAKTRVDTSYRLQNERYGTNLSALLYIATQVPATFRREDTRHFVDATALRVLGSAFLVEVGVSGMWNRSNTDFYDFRTNEASVTAFWSAADGSWLRVVARRSWLRYGTRDFQETFGGPASVRRDSAWQGVLTGEWRVAGDVAVTASADILRNRTNDSREEIDFLNYTQAIYRIGVSAAY